MNKYKVILGTIFLFGFLNATHASFIGNDLQVSFEVPDSIFFGSGGTYNTTQFEVTDSVELSAYGTFNHLSIDISDSNILLDFLTPPPGTGKIFTNLGSYVFTDFNSTIAEIIGVSISSGSGFLTSWGGSTTFDSSRISFDENSIFIDFAQIGIDADSLLSLDVTFAPSPVPVPASFWLFGTGLLLLSRLIKKPHSVV